MILLSSFFSYVSSTFKTNTVNSFIQRQNMKIKIHLWLSAFIGRLLGQCAFVTVQTRNCCHQPQ